MKKFKKLLLAVTSFALAFSMGAMAACGGGDDDDETAVVEGGGVILNPDSDAGKLAESFAKNPAKGVKVNVSYSEVEKSCEGEINADGSYKNSAIKPELYKTFTSDTVATVNLNTFEFDADETRSYTYVTDPDANITVKDYNSFRDGYVFSVNKVAPNASMNSLTWDIDDMSDEVDVSVISKAANVSNVFVVLLNLASQYTNASISNGKLTVNLNEMANNIYGEVMQTVDSINDNTTVSDIVKGNAVKHLLECVSVMVNVKSAYDNLKTLPEVSSIFAKLPAPADSDNLYTYVVKLIEDKKTAETLFSMIMPDYPASAIAPIAQFKVVELVKMIAGFDMSGAEIKNYVKELVGQYVKVSNNELKINVFDEDYEREGVVVSNFKDDFTLKNANMTFNLDGSKNITSMTLSVICEDFETDTYYADGEKYVYEDTTTITATVDLSSNAYTLRNMNNVKIMEYARVDKNGNVADGEYYFAIYEGIDMFFIVEVKNNVAVNMYATDKMGGSKGEEMDLAGAELTVGPHPYYTGQDEIEGAPAVILLIPGVIDYYIYLTFIGPASQFIG